MSDTTTRSESLGEPEPIDHELASTDTSLSPEYVGPRTPESAADLGELTSQEEAIVLAFRQQQNPAIEQAPESKPRLSRRGFLSILGGAIAAAGVGGYAATRGNKGGAQTAPPPQKTTQSSTAPSPTNEPSSQPSTPEVVDPAAAEAALNEERWSNKIPSTTFNKLDRKDRLAVVASVYYQITNGGYSKFFGRKNQEFPGGLHLFDFNPLDPVHSASELDNGQLIVDRLLFAEQAVKAQSVNGDRGEIGDEMDKEHALKMISALSYYTDQDRHPELTEDTYDVVANHDGTQDNSSYINAASRLTALNTSPRIAIGTDLEGNRIKYKDIKYQDPDVGDTYITRFVQESVSTHVKDHFSGDIVPVTMNIWLPYRTNRQKDPAIG